MQFGGGCRSTYQVADNDLAFSSSGKSGTSEGGSGVVSLRLTTGGLCGSGVLGDTSGRDSGLVGAASATSVVAASAGNLFETLVKLGRHIVCVFARKVCVSYGCLSAKSWLPYDNRKPG